jgi:glycolate oxidase FAD binding subunit
MAREVRADDFAVFDGEEHYALFAALREFPRLTLEASPNAAIFRMAILPGAMPELLRATQELSERRQMGIAILVRAAGIVYVALLPAGADADSPARLPAACRDLMQAGLQAGARPMIEWCPAAGKREVNVWPPPGSDQALAERLKRLFDPSGILAPGRFLGGV